jgi:hypothetical protein
MKGDSQDSFGSVKRFLIRFMVRPWIFLTYNVWYALYLMP